MTRLSKLGEISDNFFLNITINYQNIAQFEISGFLNMTFKQQNTTCRLVVGLVLKIKTGFRGFETERNSGFRKFTEI